MLFMVTNRRVIGGEYGDEERPNKNFEYQYAYNGRVRGQDRFEKKGKKGFETALLAELKRLKDEENVNTPKVGIYLHGYNNDYQDSIDEIFDLEKSLKIVYGHSPIIIGFSWPSSGRTAYYLSDREEVRDSVGALTRFLLDINDLATKNERDCFSTTFCIAHSMGNYMLRKGLEYLSDHLGTPTGRMLFDETLLLAPDLASKDIERDGKGKYIADFSRRVHVYYSKYDRALKASSAKRFGGNRLGRHGVDDYGNLARNVVVVDAKKYANSDSIAGQKDRENEQVSVHSSYRYHEDILSDIIRCRPWRATRRPVVRGRRRARADFRSGGGVCFPKPAERICKGIRHAVKPFVGGVGLGGRFVESRSDRRAGAAIKSLSAVLESLRQRIHPQVSREDTRHPDRFFQALIEAK